MSKECLDNLIWELGRQRTDINDAKEYILYYKNMLMDAEEEVERIIKEILEIQKDILEEEKNESIKNTKIKNALEIVLFRDLLRIKELLEKKGDLKIVKEVQGLIYNFELYFDSEEEGKDE